MCIRDSIAPRAQANIDKVHEIAEKILCVCKEALCFEDILQRLFNDFSLSMNFEQYVLIGSTVRSYLSWLKDTGRLDVAFVHGKLLWKANCGRESLPIYKYGDKRSPLA